MWRYAMLIMRSRLRRNRKHRVLSITMSILITPMSVAARAYERSVLSRLDFGRAT